MITKANIRRQLANQKGVSAIIVAIVLFVLIGFAALAIDLGYLFATRNELQNTADASALAATRKLGEIYQTMSSIEQANYSLTEDDRTAIETVAINVGKENKAAGESMTIEEDDIQIGQWDSKDRQFSETEEQPDAVRVTARREEESAMGPITTFFAKIFGRNTMGVNAVATAALTGLGQMNEGGLPLPVGISLAWYDRELTDGFCGQYVAFSPTNDPDSCAGWTSFDYNSNDVALRDILTGKLKSPEAETGDIFNFIGGEMSQQVFSDLMEAYKYKGYDVGPPIDGNEYPPANPDENGMPLGLGPLGDDYPNTIDLVNPETNERLYYPDPKTGKPDLNQPRNKHVWDTYVVVYNWSDCANPNTAIDIVGFSPIKITDVWDAGGKDGKTIRGMVTCNQIHPDNLRGGGADVGIKGSIPGLVQ